MDTGALLADAAPDAGAAGLLITALVLGLRHGIDWDHIAAITDITSTTAATEAAEEAHRAEHVAGARGHPHGGADELSAPRRPGPEFPRRSRWMLVFDSFRYAWRWLGARIHGHEHVEPLEASAYGPRTAFGVGMIHGIGAETGSQGLIIAAIGGAAGRGRGRAVMMAFLP